jgi:hypothetical protein
MRRGDGIDSPEGGVRNDRAAFDALRLRAGDDAPQAEGIAPAILADE